MSKIMRMNACFLPPNSKCKTTTIAEGICLSFRFYYWVMRFEFRMRKLSYINKNTICFNNSTLLKTKIWSELISLPLRSFIKECSKDIHLNIDDKLNPNP